MAYTAIPDADVDRDSPIKQETLEALADRDDDLKTANSGANADDLLDKFTSGHSHDGTAGEGPNIPAGGIDDGGIWKPEHIASGTLQSSDLGSNLNANNMADGCLPEDKMDGDSTNGVGVAVVNGGPSTYPTTWEITVSHGAGRLCVPTNLTGDKTVIHGIGAGSITFAASTREPTAPSTSWSYGARPL